MILVEWSSFDQANMIVEASEDEKTKKRNLFLKGVFIQGGVRNLNGRVYPVGEIHKAVSDINAVINKGESVLGECDHPDKLTINLDRVSHKIINMWMDGNMGMGKLQILPTPTGEIIRALIESDVKLGVSSRGSGDVDGGGTVSDFEIITVDIVAKPSAPAALPKPVYEAFTSRRGAIIDDLSKAVMHDPKAQKHLHKELLEWVNQLKTR